MEYNNNIPQKNISNNSLLKKENNLNIFIILATMSMKYIEEMSRKGISYKKFNSAFGAKILEKFGWKEGEGLGKAKNGITEAIQIKRREENMGLGKTKKEQIWNDKWWEQSYNNILKEIKPKQDEKKEKYNLRKKSKKKKRKK